MEAIVLLPIFIVMKDPGHLSLVVLVTSLGIVMVLISSAPSFSYN